MMGLNKKCLMYASLISVLFLFFIHYFNYLTIMNDDYFFLSERLFYAQSDTFNWFKHILLFNQSRWTWVGDTALIRPGLFILQYAYYEFLFQFSPKHTAFLITVGNVFSLMGIFLILKKHSGTYFAAIILCTLAFVNKGSVVYTWGHIQPYLLSIGFFCWWLVSRQTSRFLAFCLLACSSLLHDIVGILCIALSLLLLIKVVKFPRNSIHVILRDLDILLIGVLNIFIRLVISQNDFKHFLEFSDYINAHVVSDISNYDLFFDYASNFIKEATLDAFGSLTIPVFIFLIFLSFKFLILGLKKNQSLTLSIPLIFFLLLFSIVYFGRVVPRGNFGEWYTIFFRFSGILLFLNFFLFLEKKPRLRHQAKQFRLSYILATIILLSSLSNIQKNADYLLAEKELALESFNLLNNISEQMSALGDNMCFGGIIPEKSGEVGKTDIWSGRSQNSGELPIREILILFYRSLCSDESQQPYYLEHKGSKFTRWVNMEAEIDQNSEKLNPIFFQTNAETYFQRFKHFRQKLTPYNYFEANLGRSELRELLVFKADFEANTINLKIQNDSFNGVQLYNRGILITPTDLKYPSSIIVLNDNDLVVWQRNNSAKNFEIVASSSLPYSSDVASITITNLIGEGCSFIFNDVILATFDECLAGSGSLEIFEIPNGTPTEPILEVSQN